MIDHKLFKISFVLLLVVAIMHVVSIEFYFYWIIWWIDMPVHFLAGACVGVATLMFYSIKKTGTTVNRGEAIAVCLASAFAVGVLWEYFELYFGLTFLSDGIKYVTDTTSDIVMDLSGGLLGCLYGLKVMRTVK